MDGLDKYAAVGMEEELVKEAIEKAQRQRTILLAKVKAGAPQSEPQTAEQMTVVPAKPRGRPLRSEA